MCDQSNQQPIVLLMRYTLYDCLVFHHLDRVLPSAIGPSHGEPRACSHSTTQSRTVVLRHRNLFVHAILLAEVI